MPCNGNSSEFCGGSSRINIYDFNRTVVPEILAARSWNSLGCYTDSVAARTLSVVMQVTGGADSMTAEACQMACNAAGYTFAGVEYAAECFCDNSIKNGGPAPDGDANCNMACKGDATETCGGSNRLNLYSFGIDTLPFSTSLPTSTSTSTLATSVTHSTSASPTISNWSFAGCYVDSVNKRTLSVPFQLPPAAGDMTIEACTALCKAEGYKIAGVEYGAECFCDNAFRNGGLPETDSITKCDMACSGDPNEICGGSNRLSVYTFGNVVVGGSTTLPGPTSTSASTTVDLSTSIRTSTSSTVSATGTSTSTAHDVPAGWSYAGCYNDNINGRILGFNTPDDNKVTIESCIATCIEEGYSVVGLEYTTQCFCGEYIINGGTLASSENQCGMPCGGDDTEKCGGPDRMSIYYKGTLKVYEPPKPQETGLPDSWTYKGCLT
jgi:hypothetical protein